MNPNCKKCRRSKIIISHRPMIAAPTPESPQTPYEPAVKFDGEPPADQSSADVRRTLVGNTVRIRYRPSSISP